MVCDMFKIIWSVKGGLVLASKMKRFVVRWSHSDFLTTAAHIGYLADSSFRMTDKYLAIAHKKFHHFILKNETMCKVTWVDCKY